MIPTVDLSQIADPIDLGTPAPVVFADLSCVTDWDAARQVVVAHQPRHHFIGWSDEHLPPESATLLTELDLTLAPGGPANMWVLSQPTDRAAIDERVEHQPSAAATLLQVLRVGVGLTVEAALTVESLAYSMLLGGPEFHAWLNARPAYPAPPTDDQAVEFERHDDSLLVALNRPQRRNAFGHRMRDQLFDGLGLAVIDPSIDEVAIFGHGPAFCSGGDLAEFGTNPDVARAHLIRMEHSIGRVIGQLSERLGPRMRVRVHGACVGAGVELPAFAGHIEAAPDSTFRLPEVAMGLIPGAGGTVSVSRRIGRWRTAYLALTGRTIDATTALNWGLVDERA